MPRELGKSTGELIDDSYKTMKNTIPNWSFQEDAISKVTRDFEKVRAGRFLLVIPTGGGKTLTAFGIITRMIERKLLSRNSRVLWVVHTLSLMSHTETELENDTSYSHANLKIDSSLPSIIQVRMKSEAIKLLESGIRFDLIVIDEAHHSAATTYLSFFEFPIGILGLTATPHRMDRQELPFDKISYSITFRELVRRGVVLLPKFLPEKSTSFRIEANSLQDEGQLESFNTRDRNQLICRHIFSEANKYKFKKVVVFVGTNEHVKSLYSILVIQNEIEKHKFEHIGYIFGGNNNEKGISNESYLKWHKLQKSSVVVNCKLLNEGHDDPSIDAIVMGTPTNSILYYMQCVGRVVRRPRSEIDSKAFVIEIVDKLPNISYRVDNRWLFAEISDFLEPRIEDIKGLWPFSVIWLFGRLLQLKAKFSDLSRSDFLGLLFGREINMILFNDVPQNRIGKWRILSFPRDNFERMKFFNELSENIEEYYKVNHDYLFEQKFSAVSLDPLMKSRVFRSSIMAAFARALNLKLENKTVDSLIYLSFNR